MILQAQKKEKLLSHFKRYKNVLVAFSGGVDSALILSVAVSALGPENVLAATARSESLPERELKLAQDFAQDLGVPYSIIRTQETSSPDYLQNTIQRCYHCKSELYDKLTDLAKEKGIGTIVNGVNADDLGDYRPGIAAGREANVKSPLAEEGFTKADVRALALEMGLSNWDKPAMACLSSRIPFGTPITIEKLSMVERAEDVLIALGYPQMRVRHHGEVARIELPSEDIARFFSSTAAEKTQKAFQEIGFRFTSVDIEGFRSGKMNPV
jgi:pyridinium-3,5-biscarboxylic acid mononucleotide sulfurtransferase